MAKLRLTKIFNFEAAHALCNYDGMCKNIHGHSYKLHITITGEQNNDKNSPKYGMVLDFSILKDIVNNKILNQFEHSLILNKEQNIDFISDNKLSDRIITVHFQPTAENLTLHFVEILKNNLPPNIQLFSVKLYETESSFAEWYRDDN